MSLIDRNAISPTRTKATWKPGVSDEPIAFFRCAICGAILTSVDGSKGARLTGNSRRPIAELPYAPTNLSLSCCGAAMERLSELSHDNMPTCINISYEVVGGFNNNALRVFWATSGKEGIPRWFALKTFTGLQFKYIIPSKKPPLVFALADEDAYAYCDEDPCVCCTFHCKRGFVLYAYVENMELITLPLHCEKICD